MTECNCLINNTVLYFPAVVCSYHFLHTTGPFISCFKEGYILYNTMYIINSIKDFVALCFIFMYKSLDKKFMFKLSPHLVNSLGLVGFLARSIEILKVVLRNGIKFCLLDSVTSIFYRILQAQKL